MDDIISSQDADDRFLGFSVFGHEHHRELFAFLVEIVIKRGGFFFRREAGKEGVMLADVLLDDSGRYIGTLSEGDLLRYIKKDLDFDLTKGEDVKIADITRYRSYKPLSLESTLEDLIELAMEQNFIPILDDRGVFMGIIRRRTILEYCKKELHDSLKEAV